MIVTMVLTHGHEHGGHHHNQRRTLSCLLVHAQHQAKQGDSQQTASNAQDTTGVANKRASQQAGQDQFKAYHGYYRLRSRSTASSTRSTAQISRPSTG